MSSSRTRCPYTLRPLTDVPELSREHVIPDALGGPDSYSVQCCRATNSEIGTRVDAPLVNSDIIRALRVQHEIRSRTGDPTLKIDGAETVSKTPVQLTFSKDPSPHIRFKKPVTMSNDGTTGKFIVTPEDRDSFLRKFTEGQESKGRKVAVTNETRTPVGPLELEIHFEKTPTMRAMLKIAYLTAFEYLGDSFLDDELNHDWRSSILDVNPPESTRLRGTAFGVGEISNLLFPPLQAHQHAAVIANLQMCGPVIGVQLFGGGLYTLVVVHSATSNFHLQEGEGQVVVCDAKARTIQRRNFADHLIALANKQSGPTPFN